VHGTPQIIYKLDFSTTSEKYQLHQPLLPRASLQSLIAVGLHSRQTPEQSLQRVS